MHKLQLNEARWSMVFSRAFFRGAAVCSALSAVTVLLRIFLPRAYGPVTGFDERVAPRACSSASGSCARRDHETKVP